ncbi:hypothetical protein ACWDWU_25280 [Streptomyces sp. NPDC003442]
MRLNALRTMTSLGDGEPGPEVSFAKLYWSTWHREFGELAMDVLSIDGQGPPYDLSFAQRVFLFSRADTIYLRGVQRDPAEHHRRAHSRTSTFPGGRAPYEVGHHPRFVRRSPPARRGRVRSAWPAGGGCPRRETRPHAP